MTDADREMIARLKALEKALPEREWKWAPGDRECCQMSCKCTDEQEESCPHFEQISMADFGHGFTVDCGDYFGLDDQHAEFMTESRNAIPRLLALIDEQQRMVEYVIPCGYCEGAGYLEWQNNETCPKCGGRRVVFPKESTDAKS